MFDEEDEWEEFGEVERMVGAAECSSTEASDSELMSD